MNTLLNILDEYDDSYAIEGKIGNALKAVGRGLKAAGKAVVDFIMNIVNWVKEHLAFWKKFGKQKNPKIDQATLKMNESLKLVSGIISKPDAIEAGPTDKVERLMEGMDDAIEIVENLKNEDGNAGAISAAAASVILLSGPQMAKQCNALVVIGEKSESPKAEAVVSKSIARTKRFISAMFRAARRNAEKNEKVDKALKGKVIRSYDPMEDVPGSDSKEFIMKPSNDSTFAMLSRDEIVTEATFGDFGAALNKIFAAVDYDGFGTESYYEDFDSVEEAIEAFNNASAKTVENMFALESGGFMFDDALEAFGRGDATAQIQVQNMKPMTVIKTWLELKSDKYDFKSDKVALKTEMERAGGDGFQKPIKYTTVNGIPIVICGNLDSPDCEIVFALADGKTDFSIKCVRLKTMRHNISGATSRANRKELRGQAFAKVNSKLDAIKSKFKRKSEEAADAGDIEQATEAAIAYINAATGIFDDDFGEATEMAAINSELASLMMDAADLLA